MRDDAIGMFWEDRPQEGGRGKVVRVQPPIPDTGWVPPKDFPNLSRAKVIGIDTETYDPELLEKGPGWARGKGHIVGVSITADDDGKWYFPVRHEVEPEYNLDPDPVFSWLRDSLVNPHQPKVGANLMYDIGWLRTEGIHVVGDLIDVQYAEALLDENGQVNVDYLGQKYLGMGKETSLLYQWCADYYGGNATGKQRANIYRAPPRLVGPYAEMDAVIPQQVIRYQYSELERQGLLDVFLMECRLMPLMIEMREAGVSIDIPKAEELRDKLETREKLELQKIKKLVGFDVDINVADSLAQAFDTLGLKYGLTKKSKKPSFTKPFLENVQHPIGNHIREVRKLAKLRGTFIESYLLGSHINGRVYGQFHLLRGDENGTRSGRLSSSNPNLQNIPVRDEELAPLMRGLFIPDAGHAAWRKYDYSQIEYRFLIHFAVGPGSDEARALFNNYPDTDYHEMALDLVAPQAGWDISTKALRKQHRRPIKNINFGLIYGMGVDKLSGDLGLSKAQGKKLFAAYHKGVPFAKQTMDSCSEMATATGIITTILGRRSRFDLWEPVGWGHEAKALTYDTAIRTYGNIQRAYTHKALNRRLQGSAADLMKRAMLNCYEAGIFDEIGVPRLTVHDELDFSDPGGKDEGFKEMQRYLENAIPISIPVKADGEIGPNWGMLKDIKD